MVAIIKSIKEKTESLSHGIGDLDQILQEVSELYDGASQMKDKINGLITIIKNSK